MTDKNLDGYIELYFTINREYEILCKFCDGELYFDTVHEYIEHSICKHNGFENAFGLPEDPGCSKINRCQCVKNHIDTVNLIINPSTRNYEIHCCKCEGHFIFYRIDDYICHSLENHKNAVSKSRNANEKLQAKTSNETKETTEDHFKIGKLDIVDSEQNEVLLANDEERISNEITVYSSDSEIIKADDQNISKNIENMSNAKRKSESIDDEVVPSKKVKKNLICTICSKSYVRKYHYDMHLKRDHPHSQCNLCEISFDAAEKLFQHLEEHLNESQCPICNEIINWNTKEHLTRHFKLLSCSKCIRFFTMDKNILQSHFSNCGQFICKFCNYICKNANEFRRHALSIHENTEPFECDRCEEKFQYFYGLSEHKKLCV